MGKIKGLYEIANKQALTVEEREATIEARTLKEALHEIEQVLQDPASQKRVIQFDDVQSWQARTYAYLHKVKYEVSWLTDGSGVVDHANHWVESGTSGRGDTAEEAFTQASQHAVRADEKPFDPTLARLLAVLGNDAAGYEGFVRRFEAVLTEEERKGLRAARDEVEKVLVSVRARGE